MEELVVMKSVLLCFSPILGLFYSGAYIDNTPSFPPCRRTGAVVIALGERDVFLRGSGAPRQMSAAVESDGKDGPALLLLMTVLAQTFFTFVSGHLVAFSFLSAGHCCCLG